MAQSSTNPQDCLQHAAISDVGMRRANNQDSYTVLPANSVQEFERRGHFFMVADGMGAHAAGELASKLAVDGVPHLYSKYNDLPPAQALEKAIAETNAEIHRRGNANLDFRNMGTTASSMVLLPQGAYIGHVGDSRIYRARGNQLEQLTFDHSLVWELRAAGQLPKDAEESGAIPKNVITRSLGPNAHVQVDIEGPYPVEVGDTFLLCSDGLTGPVDDEELGALMANLDPEEAVRALVDLSNLRGGPDNVTVVIVRVGKDFASSGQAAAPMDSGQGASGAHPVLWAISPLLVLIGVALIFAEQFAFGAILAGLGALLLVVAVALQFGREGGAPRQQTAHGKGPYRRIACPVSDESVGRLGSIVNDLRQAAKDENWEVDWKRLDQFQQKAQDAVKRGEGSQALLSHVRAITFMMKELRMQQHRDASDSAIDY